jgi:hypothetical protein
MYLCQNCNSKDMYVVYESATHLFLRCPDCYKMDTRRAQLNIRGKVLCSDKVVETNECSGVINGK